MQSIKISPPLPSANKYPSRISSGCPDSRESNYQAYDTPSADSAIGVQWHQPTLEETLQASEGEHKLRKPYSLGLISESSPCPQAPMAGLQGIPGPAAAASHVTAEALRGIADRLGRMLPAWDVETYWREWLELAMEGPVVAAVIGALIFLDVVLLVYFEAALTGDDTSAAVVGCSTAVLVLFLAELALRNAAQGRRFWRSAENLFDSVVVGGSVVMAAVNRAYEARLQAMSDSDVGQQGQLRGTTDVLKVTSRVFLVLRAVRILQYIRRLRKLGGQIRRQIRGVVSQNKRRLVVPGFDLDLTYITDRVVAMAAPAFGGHRAYRNDIYEVLRLLTQRHYGHFRVYNLCDSYLSSDGLTGNYHPRLLLGQVRRIAMRVWTVAALPVTVASHASFPLLMPLCPSLTSRAAGSWTTIADRNGTLL